MKPTTALDWARALQREASARHRVAAFLTVGGHAVGWRLHPGVSHLLCARGLGRYSWRTHGAPYDFGACVSFELPTSVSTVLYWHSTALAFRCPTNSILQPSRCSSSSHRCAFGRGDVDRLAGCVVQRERHLGVSARRHGAGLCPGQAVRFLERQRKPRRTYGVQ